MDMLKLHDVLILLDLPANKNLNLLLEFISILFLTLFFEQEFIYCIAPEFTTLLESNS